MKISRSGLRPISTLCQLIPVEPTHGAMASTKRPNNAHGPTTTRNRPADRLVSCGWNDVAAEAVRPPEDSGLDFKNFIKTFGRQDLAGRAIGDEVSCTDSDHPPGITRSEIDTVRGADERDPAVFIQTLQDVIELNLVLQIEIHSRFIQQ